MAMAAQLIVDMEHWLATHGWNDFDFGNLGYDDDDGGDDGDGGGGSGGTGDGDGGGGGYGGGMDPWNNYPLGMNMEDGELGRDFNAQDPFEVVRQPPPPAVPPGAFKTFAPTNTESDSDYTEPDDESDDGSEDDRTERHINVHLNEMQMPEWQRWVLEKADWHRITNAVDIKWN